MPIYNLIEYSKSYRKKTCSLWNHYRDEPNNHPANNYTAYPLTNSASFNYKSSIIWKTPNNDNDDNNTKDIEIAVQLKYLSDFRKTLDMSLINSKINLIPTWPENCILTYITT